MGSVNARTTPSTGFNFKYATIPNDASQSERTSVSRATARDAAGTRRAQKCSEYTTNVVALPENLFAVGRRVRQTRDYVRLNRSCGIALGYKGGSNFGLCSGTGLAQLGYSSNQSRLCIMAQFCHSFRAKAVPFWGRFD